MLAFLPRPLPDGQRTDHRPGAFAVGGIGAFVCRSPSGAAGPSGVGPPGCRGTDSPRSRSSPRDLSTHWIVRYRHRNGRTVTVRLSTEDVIERLEKGFSQPIRRFADRRNSDPVPWTKYRSSFRFYPNSPRAGPAAWPPFGIGRTRLNKHGNERTGTEDSFPSTTANEQLPPVAADIRGSRTANHCRGRYDGRGDRSVWLILRWMRG
jgi:hypothetical protein